MVSGLAGQFCCGCGRRSSEKCRELTYPASGVMHAFHYASCRDGNMLQHGKRPTIASRHGMVAAAHPLAAAAGARMLSNGGNAFERPPRPPPRSTSWSPTCRPGGQGSRRARWPRKSACARSLHGAIPRSFPLDKLDKRERSCADRSPSARRAISAAGARW